jgi:hypothetical protein
MVAVVCLALSWLVIAMAVPSGGAQAVDVNSLVDGPFTGSGTVEPDPSCDHVTNGMLTLQDYVYGEGKPDPQAGTVHIEACVEVLTTPFPVEGTFTLESRNGSTLTGTVSGTTTGDTFQSTFTVQSGTRDFEGVSGTISAEGTSNTQAPVIEDVEGTFVSDLQPAEQEVDPTTPVTVHEPTPPAAPVEAEPSFTG